MKDLETDLVVIFGKNNSGKSYGIYVVYLLVKTLLNVQRSWSSTRTLPSDDVLEHEFLAEFQQAFSATFDKVDNITSRFSGQSFSLSLCTQVAELTLEVKDKKRVLTKASLLRELLTKSKSIRLSAQFVVLVCFAIFAYPYNSPIKSMDNEAQLGAIT